MFYEEWCQYALLLCTSRRSTLLSGLLVYVQSTPHQTLFSSEILSSQSSEDVNIGLLDCKNVWTCRQIHHVDLQAETYKNTWYYKPE